jgi:TonB family protein
MRMLIAAASVLVVSLSMPLAAQDVYRVGERVTGPKLVQMSKPHYGFWVAKGLAGVVRLEIDVMPDGTVGTVALIESSGSELDEVAVDAAKRIKFTPGARDGKPVAVRLALDLEFDSRARVPMRWMLDPQSTPN